MDGNGGALTEVDSRAWPVADERDDMKRYNDPLNITDTSTRSRASLSGWSLLRRLAPVVSRT